MPMPFSEIRKWIKEEFADAILLKSNQLCTDNETDLDDFLRIKEERNRLLKFLGMKHKIPNGKQ